MTKTCTNMENSGPFLKNVCLYNYNVLFTKKTFNTLSKLWANRIERPCHVTELHSKQKRILSEQDFEIYGYNHGMSCSCSQTATIVNKICAFHEYF